MRHENYAKNPGCPVEVALELIGGKWKGVILYHLLDGTRRFNELRRLMPAVTQRMLTLQLRELEEHGVVARTVYPEVPPRVEYALTDFGRTLQPVMAGLRDWGLAYLQGAAVAPRSGVQAEQEGDRGAPPRYSEQSTDLSAVLSRWPHGAR